MTSKITGRGGIDTDMCTLSVITNLMTKAHRKEFGEKLAEYDFLEVYYHDPKGDQTVECEPWECLLRFSFPEMSNATQEYEVKTNGSSPFSIEMGTRMDEDFEEDSDEDEAVVSEAESDEEAARTVLEASWLKARMRGVRYFYARCAAM